MPYEQKHRSTGKPTGKFWGEYRTKDKTFRRLFDSRGEATGYEAYVKAAGEEPAHLAFDAPTHPFRDIVERFRLQKPEWGKRDPSGVARLEWLVSQIGHLDINAVTTEELDKLTAKLARLPGRNGTDRMSPATVNRYLHAASAVLTFAFRRRILTHMPHVPTLDTKSERLLTVSPELERQILAWINTNRDPRHAFVITVLIETGLRRAELWKLRPQQVTVATDEEGDENGWITLDADQTKTDEAREVWIRPELAKKLKASIAAGTLPKAYRVYRIFKAAVEACGGAKDLCLHSLRHTRATRMIEAEVDSMVVAKTLGHRSTATTKRYVHPGRKALAKAAKKVSPAAGETPVSAEIIPLKELRKAI